MKTLVENGEIQALETRLLLQAIYERYGYDYRNYAPGSLRRRVHKCMEEEHLGGISQLQERVLRDPDCMTRLLLNLSINVSDMFRDPEFYAALRTKVLPLLRTYPFVRIWLAGCSTGEEVYSIAILLQEEGLYKKSRIFATDMNEVVLQKAKEGIFPLGRMQQYTKNYLAAGGKGSFSDYYTAKYDNAIFRPDLRKNVVFAQHNLASDQVFNEFNLILCRNVMIYFDKELQGRVYGLFHQSLCMFGFLGLGSKETMRFSPHERCYEELDHKWKLYKRIK